MKIIKSTRQLEKRIECPHCKSVLEYGPQDVVKFYPSIMDIRRSEGEKTQRDYIKCPVCSNAIYLD